MTLLDFDAYTRGADGRFAIHGLTYEIETPTEFEVGTPGVEVLENHLHDRTLDILKRLGGEDEVTMGGFGRFFQQVFLPKTKLMYMSHEKIVVMPGIAGADYQAKVRLVTEQKNVPIGQSYQIEPGDATYTILTPLVGNDGVERNIITMGLGEFNVGMSWIQLGSYAPVSRMDMGDCLMLGQLLDKIEAPL